MFVDSEIFVDHGTHLWIVFCGLQPLKSNKNLNSKEIRNNETTLDKKCSLHIQTYKGDTKYTPQGHKTPAQKRLIVTVVES